MNSNTRTSNRSNVRTFIVSLLAYVLLTSQLAPLAMAAKGAANAKANRARMPIGVSDKKSGAAEQVSNATQFAPVPKPLPAPTHSPKGAPPVVTIVATKTDNRTPAQPAAPGDTINYTVVIQNTGTASATGVTFTDTIDANTALVPNSIVSTPIANNDSYNVIGNVRIQPNVAQGLLSNDFNPDTGDATGITASGGTTSTQNGNVVINADGSFSYNPAPGFTGTDTFTYTLTVTATGKTDTGTVTLTVGNGTAAPGANVIWFIDPAAAAGGDGRLTAPFNCYTGPAASCFSTTAADDPGDSIFLYSGAHTGGNTLANNQRLIGQGASDTLTNLSGLTVPTGSDALPATGGASPTITTVIAATVGVPLGQGNTLRGFTVGDVTGTKISGNTFGTLTVGNNTTPDVILNGNGRALGLVTGTIAATSGFVSVATTSSTAQGILFSGVAGTVSFGSTSVSGATTQGILIGTTTADINFGNTTVSGGTDGVSFQNNSAGTRTFGTLGVSGGSGNAFIHGAGGGNVTISGAATLSSAGDAISVSAPGATNVINFQAATSATRTAAGGNGVNWAGTAGATMTFSALTIQTNAGTGLNATTGGSINVTNGTGTINNATQAAAAIVANGIALNANFSAINSSGGTNGVSLTNVTGTSNFGGGQLTGTVSGATFLVSGGTATLTYAGNISQGNNAPLLSISGGHSGTITFNTGLLLATGGTGAQFDNADGTYNFNGQISLNGGSASVDILNGSDGTFNFASSANISNPTGIAFTVNGGTANVTYNGAITKNNDAAATISITNHATGTITFQGGAIGVGSGTGLLFNNADGTYNFSVASGNTILFGGDAGIDIIGGSGGTFTFGTGVGIVNPTGIAYQETVSAPNVTFNGSINQSNAASAVVVGSKSGGTTTFNGAIVASTTTAIAISLTSNVGGTINFTGGLNLTTTSGVGFNATGGGTISATQNNTTIVNTITSTTGTALNVTTTTIGASGLTFRSITANGGSNGIVLNTTGAGGLSVTGNGGTCTTAATCTGGAIQNTTGDGVSLNAANNVSLVRMFFANIGDAVSDNASCDLDTATGCTSAIDILGGSSNITLDRIVIDGDDGIDGAGGGNAAGQIGISGNQVNGLTLTNSTIKNVGESNDESGMLMTDAQGTILIQDVTITDPAEYGIRFYKLANTTLNLTLQRVTIQHNISTFGEAGFSIRADGGTSRVLVDDCDLLNTDGPGVDAQAINAAILHTTVQATIFTENRALPMAVNATTFNTAQHFVKISGNTVNDCAVAADCSIAFDIDANDTSTLHAIVTNNTVPTGTGIGTGMEFVVGDASLGRAEVRDNTFVMNTGEIGMLFHARQEAVGGSPNNGRLDVTFEGNSISGIQDIGIFNPGVQFLAGSSTGTHNQDVCVNIATSQGAGGNTITGVNNPGFTPRFEVTQRTGTVFILQGFTGTGTSAASVGSHFDTNNNATTLDPTFVRSTGTAIVQYTTGTCNTPATPTLPSGPIPIGGQIETPSASTAAQIDAPPVSQPAVTVAVLQPARMIVASATKSAEGGGMDTPKTTYRQWLNQDLSWIHTEAETGRAPQLSKSGASKLQAKDGDTKKPIRPKGITPTVANFPITFGTLGAGKSVTITFSVTVSNPLPGGVTQVSNQGTVSGGNFANVLTDDPDVAGSANPTVTAIVAAPDIFARDARAPEPTAGTANMLFTVALSIPAPGPVSVNYATANDTGGGNPATGGTCAGGADYETTSGTVNFTAGQRLQTIAVPICSDAAVETDETLLLNLSTPVGGNISDGQAVGTITSANTPGEALISEVRTSGPGGTADEFVELYNNSDTPATVQADDASPGVGLFKMGAACTDTPVLIGTIPNGTVVPARGHYLFVGSAYSLGAYAAGDSTLTADIENDRNIGFFSTTDVGNLSTETRLDAVGFGTNTGGNCDLLREGTNLQPALGSTAQHSFVRKMTTGLPQDTNDNAADFVIVATDPTVAVGSNPTPILGAPGPENLASPIQRNATVKASLIDTAVASTAAPNRVRDNVAYSDTLTPSAPNGGAPATNPYTLGTLLIRRKFTNNTGANVTRLRFRIVDITTTNSPGAGLADVRALSSLTSSVATTCCGTVNVLGITLEQPPTQARGGGLNSSMAAGTVTVGTPIANGASINVNLLLGVASGGTFRFFINVEALP